MIKGVLFDVSGVLISSNHMDALKWMARKLGMDDVSTAKSVENFKKEFTNAKNSEYRTVSSVINTALGTKEDTKSMYLEFIASEVMACQGSREFLGKLKGKYKLGIVTNTDDSLNTATLEKLGMKEMFDVAVTAESARAYKTNKKLFSMACEKMNLAPEEILWVGHSLDDNAIAKAVGMKTALVSVEENADYNVSMLEELLDKVLRC